MPRVEILRYDKVVHAIVYSVLGGLFFLALRQTSSLTVGRLIVLAAAFAFIYGVTDEVHQLFVPGRSAEVYDALADGIGGMLGASGAAWIPIAKPGAAG